MRRWTSPGSETRRQRYWIANESKGLGIRGYRGETGILLDRTAVGCWCGKPHLIAGPDLHSPLQHLSASPSGFPEQINRGHDGVKSLLKPPKKHYNAFIRKQPNHSPEYFTESTVVQTPLKESAAGVGFRLPVFLRHPICCGLFPPTMCG